MNKLLLATLATIPVVFIATGPLAAEVQPGLSTDIGWTQKLNSKLPLQEMFLDETGNPYQLKNSFANKPVILTFVYYQCPNLCTLVLNGLTDVLKKINEKPGKDFHLVTISIDPREKPRLALMKKRTYVARLGPDSTLYASFWKFLTGEEKPLENVSRAAGFRYRYDATSDQYAHPSGLIVLSPDGVIRQYFSGIRFDSRELSLALDRASRFQSGSIIDQIMIFCFHYDPESSKNGKRILFVIRAIGALFAIVFFVMLARRFSAEDVA